MALIWRGKQVDDLMVKAAKFGVDKIIEDASIHARNNHPWRNRSGILEGSIRPVIRAREQGNMIVGLWGSVDVRYAIFLELGTMRHPPFPFLRPAADVHYPRLGRVIREAFARFSVVRARRSR